MYLLHYILVTVLVVNQLHAVPVRNHGGIRFDTEFLHVLDPRTRSSTSAASEKFDQSTATSKITPVPNHPGEPPGGTPLIPSRSLRKIESSTTSTVSTVSSSSSTVSSSQSIHDRQSISTSRQKLNPVNPKDRISNSIRKNVKSSSTSNVRNRPLSPSRTSILEDNIDNTVNSPVLGSDTDFALYDEYDYYYYYTEDFQSKFPSDDELKENSTYDTLLEKDISNKITTPRESLPETSTTTQKPNVLLSRDRIISKNDIKTSTAAPTPQRTTTSKGHTSPTTNPTTNSLASLLNSQSSQTTTTTIKPKRRQLSFRYQTASTSTRVEVPFRTTPTSRTTVPQVTTKPPVSRTKFPLPHSTESPELISNNIKTTTTQISTEIPSLTTIKENTIIEDQVSEAPERNRLSQVSSTEILSKIRNGNEKDNSPTTTTSKPINENSVPSPIVSSTTTTVEPPVNRNRNNQQNTKELRQNTSRSFRYTTPSSNAQQAKDATVTEKVISNDNPIQKSLGTSSTSSVVVQIRVESPRPPLLRPQARRLSLTEPSASQILEKNKIKSSTASPRRVHTIDPDRHTTSFLLSDSLVVDLKSGPKTSNQQTGEPKEQKPSSPSSFLGEELALTTPKSKSLETLEPQSKKESTATSTSNPNAGKSTTSFQDLKKENANATVTVRPKRTHSSFTNTEDLLQSQSQSISSISVSRTVALQSENTSNNSELTKLNISADTHNLTVVSNSSLLFGNSSILRRRLSLQKGISPHGVRPFGIHPEGITPFGESPEGIRPFGLHPLGLDQYGVPVTNATLLSLSNSTNTNITSSITNSNNTNLNTTNSKETSQSAKLTLVDSRVAEGGANANKSIGYVAVEQNVSRFRLEEKTPDGFIIGEYGEVDHVTGDVNGVRYTAEGNADPNLIYDALIKFLSL